MASEYRGRIAPTPSGPLHLGHSRTFLTAQVRAQQAGGIMVLRNEDLDPDRCKPRFAEQMLEDLAWFGLTWHEGPDVGGPYAPYQQSLCLDRYQVAWKELARRGVIYPSAHSRRDIAAALVAPHDPPAGEDDAEPIFPPDLRPANRCYDEDQPGAVNWRFRVPDGETLRFFDHGKGWIQRTAGVDFGDFLVWRKDGFPSYELAVVHDDHTMQISEVVRGEDLLTSTARQLLIYRALDWPPPAFYHCPLMCDAQGRRLAKRTDAVSLATLRSQGQSPEALRASW